MQKSIIALLIFTFSLLQAQYVGANYLTNPKVPVFIDDMVKINGFDRDRLTLIFSQAEKKDSILKAISRPAEKRLEWKSYRKIFLTTSRIQQGKEFINTYQKDLDRAEKVFGVPKYIIAAIIGVETRYGRHAGSYRVIDSLSTLAFDYPPRSSFFKKQLAQFLLLSREQQLDVLSVKGSYAGAMGYGQFIPSSYRHYAVDFSGDKHADIINNVPDAIGSVANYFKMHKWQKGEPVAFTAIIKSKTVPSDLLSKNLKPSLSIQELNLKGISSSVSLSPETKAKLLVLKGDKGDEYWLALNNFYVITRYNHSPLYAMAVFQLSEAIKKANQESSVAIGAEDEKAGR
jgi:membrane-bound lytic murein transglycosylase B